MGDEMFVASRRVQSARGEMDRVMWRCPGIGAGLGFNFGVSGVCQVPQYVDGVSSGFVADS